MQHSSFPCFKRAACVIASAIIASFCFGGENVQSGHSNRIGIYPDQVIGDGQTAISFLGVHSLWWEYPNGLVDRKTLMPAPLVIDFFSKTRGVNRFGGGANEVPWDTCVGPISKRASVNAAKWLGPTVCEFGLLDYFRLNSMSNSSASWLIANIAGLDYKEWSDDDLKNSVNAAANFRRINDPSALRYWELGNELERGAYKWPPKKISRKYNISAEEIRLADPQAKVIVPLIEYDAPGQPDRVEFNEAIISSLNFEPDGFSMHMYYDGSPGGPAIPRQTGVLVSTIKQIRTILGKRKGVWLTEHGRWPEGDTSSSDWKKNWHKTNDIDGVISTADFIIATSQIDGVDGLMLHAVKAGPWNIFEVNNGRLIGITGTGELLKFMAPAFNGRRIETSTLSTNQSGYKGGYDVRASAFLDNGLIHLIVVNRAAMAQAIDVEINNGKDDHRLAQARLLKCEGVAEYCRLPKPYLLTDKSIELNKIKAGSIHVSPKSIGHFVFERISR